MQEKILNSLKQQNARLRKAIKDKLGDGVWGLLKDKEDFTHEEIVFLFARVYPVFGIDHIKKIRTNYPDCICVKDGNEVSVEFEPLLSSFQEHINKHDLSECNYIVCWDDDLDAHSSIWEEIEKNNITIILLKRFYEEGRVRKRAKSLEWAKKDFEKLTADKLKSLYAFIALDKEILTLDEIGEYLNKKGKSLGGILGTFTKNKDWLIREHPSGGWQFNQTYKQKVIETVKKFKLYKNT